VTVVNREPFAPGRLYGSPVVQNVHAMRPEVRAGYEAARERVSGDTAFLTRLERFFTELRDPLFWLDGALVDFTAEPRPIRTAVISDRGTALDEDAGALDGRPRETGGDYAVLAPYRFAWVAG
jgi:hypothetical protein